MDQTLQRMGRRLYERRKQMNLSQETLAELAGVTAQTISTAELGKKAMRADTVIHICEALKISPNYLLLGTVSAEDTSLISEKLTQLTPTQYRHLEDIINTFIAVIEDNEGA